ncbi:MAG: hypothetical protein HFG41_13280 [Coprococcus sp.]|nr:hypothetical protein [Coprococcus sp.]
MNAHTRRSCICARGENAVRPDARGLRDTAGGKDGQRFKQKGGKGQRKAAKAGNRRRQMNRPSSPRSAEQGSRVRAMEEG